MNNLKRVLLTGVIVGLFSLSGCHGNPGNSKVRWVNESDSKKVLEMTLQNPTVMGRLHMVVFAARVRGTYVFNDGDKTTEGRVIQTEDAYRLTSSDGKEQKFSRERTSGTLTDESGATWKPDNPPKTTVTLKEF